MNADASSRMSRAQHYVQLSRRNPADTSRRSLDFLSVIDHERPSLLLLLLHRVNREIGRSGRAASWWLLTYEIREAHDELGLEDGDDGLPFHPDDLPRHPVLPPVHRRLLLCRHACRPPLALRRVTASNSDSSVRVAKAKRVTAAGGGARRSGRSGLLSGRGSASGAEHVATAKSVCQGPWRGARLSL